MNKFASKLINYRVSHLICFFLASVFFSVCLAADVYKWKDLNGKIHFSDRDPNQSAERVALRPDIGEERAEQARKESKEFVYRQQRKSDFQKEEIEKVKKLEREKEHKLAEQKNYCSKAKRELRMLKAAVPVYRTDKTGERRYVDDAQREAEIKEWSRNIRGYCK